MSDKLAFCEEVEDKIIAQLKSKGIKNQTLKEMDVYVKPSGSGFRATIQLPNRVSHGSKISEFFYRRDADNVVDMLLDDYKIQNLIDNQAELAKPARKPSSTAAAISEARNSTDPDRLRELSRHNAESVRKVVEKNAYTPDDALIDMLKNDTYVDYHNVTKNIRDLRKLYEAFPENKVSSNPTGLNVFAVLTHNENTPQDILLDILDLSEPDTDEFHSIWLNLASNPNSPDEVFRTLYDGNNKRIDWRLSLNSSIPEDVAEGLIDRYQDSTDSYYANIVDHCNAILNGTNPYRA